MYKQRHGGSLAFRYSVEHEFVLLMFAVKWFLAQIQGEQSLPAVVSQGKWKFTHLFLFKNLTTSQVNSI